MTKKKKKQVGHGVEYVKIPDAKNTQKGKKRSCFKKEKKLHLNYLMKKNL